MKFKATVRDARTFAGICQACRGIQRQCVIKLHPMRIRFFTSTQTTEGMHVWGGCRTQSIFCDFHAQSHQPENAIYCEVADLAGLLHIMRQAERCPNVSIKLTKNAARRPALRVSMQGVLPHLDISHDVQVRVLSELEVQRISSPQLESEMMQLVLPSLSELTLFVDKVRSTSCERMTFTAHGNPASSGGEGSDATTGTLIIEAECFLGSFALKYNSVELCKRDDDVEAEVHDDCNSSRECAATVQQASVSVELRRFARFLVFRDITPLHVVLHLVDGEAIVLSVAASGGTTVVGYMPAMLR